MFLGWSRFWRPGSHGQSQPNKDYEGHKGSHEQVSDLLYASSPSPRLASPATWCRTAKLACCASPQNGRRPDSRGALELSGRGHCAGPPTGPGRRDLCSRDVERLPYRRPISRKPDRRMFGGRPNALLGRAVGSSQMPQAAPNATTCAAVSSTKRPRCLAEPLVQEWRQEGQTTAKAGFRELGMLETAFPRIGITERYAETLPIPFVTTGG